MGVLLLHRLEATSVGLVQLLGSRGATLLRVDSEELGRATTCRCNAFIRVLHLDHLLLGAVKKLLTSFRFTIASVATLFN